MSEVLLACGDADCAERAHGAVAGLSWSEPEVRALRRIFGRIIDVSTQILEAIASRRAAVRTKQVYGSVFAQPVVEASNELIRAIESGRSDLTGATTRLADRLKAYAASKRENMLRMERRRKEQEKAGGAKELKKFVLDAAAERHLVVYANVDEEVSPDFLSDAAADACAFFDAYGQAVESPITMLEVKGAFPSAFAAVARSVFLFVKILPCVALWPSGLEAERGILGDEALQAIVMYHRSMFGNALDSVTRREDGADEPAPWNAGEQEPDSSPDAEPTEVGAWMSGRPAGRRVWNAVRAASQMTTRVSKNTSPEHGCFTSAQIHHAVERDGGGPISLRYVQVVLRALRRFKQVAPASIHKIAPRDHPRSFWALANVRYREAIGRECAGDYVRYALGDMSKIPVLQVLSTKGSTQKAAK